jgi:uncharacterized membrane protein
VSSCVGVAVIIGKPIYSGAVRVSKSYGDGKVSWKDLLIIALVILGIVLFLYGSNYYEPVSGWAGVALVIGGFVAEIVLRIVEFLRKKEDRLEAVQS